MALLDSVQLRYSVDQIRRLTNPDDPSATAIVVSATGRLQLACDDVEADFETEVGVEYSNDNAQHLSVACEGVIAKLSMRGAQSRSVGQQLHDEYLSRLFTLRGRVTPRTTSPLTVTVETSRDKPWSDTGNFHHVEPEHRKSNRDVLPW